MQRLGYSGMTYLIKLRQTLPSPIFASVTTMEAKYDGISNSWEVDGRSVCDEAVRHDREIGCACGAESECRR